MSGHIHRGCAFDGQVESAVEDQVESASRISYRHIVIDAPEQAPAGLFALPARQWVDLFYDLAVAAGIIALSGAYAYDHSPVGTLWFALAYALLWCTWLLTSSATGSFTAEGATHTVWSFSLLVAQMGAMLLLAIAATDSVDASAEVFDILLGVALLIVAILAVRARRHGLGGARRIPVLAGLATLTLVGSWFLDARLSLLVWCLALALVAWAAWAVTSDPRIDQHRLRHRLGELTIIVLGEILVKMVLTVGEETLWSVSLVALVPSFGILSAIWWAYFVTGDRSRSSSRGSRRVQVAAHLPLHVGLLGLAVGLAKLVVGSDSLTQADGATALLAGPLAVVMGSLALVAYAGAVPSQRVLRLGAAAAAALVVVGVLTGLTAAPTAYAGFAIALGTAATAAWRG